LGANTKSYDALILSAATDEAGMSSTIEQMYQEIGQVAAGSVEGSVGKLLVYSEVEQGAISSDIFYVNQADDVVRLRFSPKPLTMLVYSFWERWKEQPGNHEWRAMAYVIDGGKFSIDLTYPDQIDPGEDITTRRPSVVRKHFGNRKVDYSKP
jgi:hypothetical protein